MTQDHPDWWMEPKPSVYALTEDLGELAARLGSIHVFDRRGDIVWWDAFREGLGAWAQTTGGTGAAIALDTTYPMWPPFCVKLMGGSTGTGAASIDYYQGLPALYRLGVEASIAFITTWDTFTLRLAYYDGALYRVGGIRLSDTDDQIQYYNSDGAWTDLEAMPYLRSSWGAYHQCKLVMDFDTETYVRFLLDKDSYDLSAYALYQEANLANPQLRANLDFRSRSGQNDYCYVDGVILTQDEP